MEDSRAVDTRQDLSLIHISKSNGKGKIEIEYYSEEELERIYDLIMTIQNK